MSARRPTARNVKHYAMLVPVLSLACGSSDGTSSAGPSSSGASYDGVPPSVPWATLAEETGCSIPAEPSGRGVPISGDAVDAVVAVELSASSSTTPEQLSLVLHTNLDHVRVDAYLTDIYANPVSDCQNADIYRIGNAAVNWPIGDAYELSLSYEQVLEPGLYVQKVRAYCDLGKVGRITHRPERYFEVTGDGMRPVDAGEYFARLDAGLYDLAREPAVPPAIPCDEPPPHSDQVAPADATSSVDIDSWVNVSTRQPWRWAGACVPYGNFTPYSLEFYARNDAGQRLSLGISFVPQEPARAFETSEEWSFVPDGPTPRTSMRLMLEEADGTRWESSAAGNVRVQRGEGDQLLVTLSDVILEKHRMTTREPVVTRTIGTGSIMGTFIGEALY